MPTSSKISKEAFMAAKDKIGGLLSCQPSAPGIGLKSSLIPKRVSLS